MQSQFKSFANVTFQFSFGGTATASAWAVAFDLEQIESRKAYIPYRANRGTFKTMGIYGKQTFPLNLEFVGSPDHIALGLSAIMDRFSVSSGDTIIHTFAPNTSDFNERVSGWPFTVELNRDESQSYFYTDVNGTSFNMSVKNGELCTCALNAQALSMQKTTKTSAGIYPENTPFKWDNSSMAMFGVSVPDFLDFSVQFNNNITPLHTLRSSKKPFKLKKASELGVSIGGSVFCENNSLQNAFENEITFSLSQVLQVNSVQFNLTFSQVRLTEYAEMNDGGVYMSKFTAEPELYANSGTLFSCEIITNNAIYPSYFIVEDSYFGLLDYNALG